MKALWAYTALALQWWAHVLSWPVRITRLRGLAAFRHYYFREGLVALSAGSRAALPRVSRCIACGLCDVLAPDASPPLSQLIAALARSGPDFPAAAADWARLRSVSADAVQRLCPVAIDIREVQAYVGESAQAIADTHALTR